MKRIKKIFLALTLILTNVIFAQSQIPFSVLSSGGGRAVSDNYKVVGTLGQPAVGISGSENYIAAGGFWYLFSDNVTAVENEEDQTPAEFKLEQNYPNPFNPSTTIKFSLKEPSFTEIKIYNILGAEVANLIGKNLEAGNYQVVFDARNLASGIYIYRIIAGNFVETKKMNLIK